MNNKQVSQKWPIVLFTIGVFMAGLDNSIISTALTTIYNSFGVSPSWGAWMITLYTFMIAISVPIIGKLSDNYGRKRLFIIEIFLFGLGSFLVAVSPNFVFLLIARCIQAIGGGGIFIIGSSHVLATLPKKQQGKALGLLGGMHGLSAVIGPNAGAIILHITGSWEWMFLINIPISIFLIIMGAWKLKETKEPTNLALDLSGMLYLSIFVVSIMLGITNLHHTEMIDSLFSIHVLPFLLIAIISIVLFLRHEQKLEQTGGDPIIPFALLKKGGFRLTLVLGLLSGAFLSTIIYIPSYVQQVLQIPAENAGFWLTPLALASGVGAGLGGFLTDRIGARKTVMISGVIGLTGFYLLYAFDVGTGLFFMASVLAGIGLGFLLGAPLNVLITEDAKENQYGTSIGALSLLRQIGLTLFPAIFASFITGGVMKIQPTIENVFSDNVIHFPSIGGGEGYDRIIEEIGKIEDPYLKHQLLELVANVMNTGFQTMFLAAVTISILVILIGFLLKTSRNLDS